MKNSEPKEIFMQTCWAVFAPDGYVQVRSIAHTKKLSKEMLCLREYSYEKQRFVAWDDYKKAGYTIRKVNITMTLA